MTDRRSYDERLFDELRKESSSLSNQRGWAWVVVGTSAFFLASNIFGIVEPYHKGFGIICLIGLIGSSLWLHKVRGELARNARRSLELSVRRDQKYAASLRESGAADPEN